MEEKWKKGEQAEEDKGEKGGGESAKGRGGEERRALLKMALGRREGAPSSESPLTAQPAPGRLPLSASHTQTLNLLLSGSLERGSAIFARPAPRSFVCGCCCCCWGGSSRLGGLLLLLLRRLHHRHHQTLVLR